MAKIPTRKLNNGTEIPVIGLGTYKENNEQVLKTAIRAAVTAGYRHFDCAYCYYNEEIIGQTLRECIAESNGALKREDFFIVSKLWNIFHSKEKIEKALDDTLKRFGFDYLDLYLIHWPMGFKEDAGNDPMDSDGKYVPSDIHFTETYREMEEMVKKGKTKSIGLSNFNPKQVKEILDMCTIRPVCNQFEVNPNLHNNEWIDYCKKENIAVVAYAPLGAPDRMWLKEEDPVPLKSEIVAKLAAKYGKSPAQVILRWLIQRDVIIIPKSANPTRLAENLNVFDFNLTQDECDLFKSFKEFRFYSFDACNNHPLYPF